MTAYLAAVSLLRVCQNILARSGDRAQCNEAKEAAASDQAAENHESKFIHG